MCMVCTRASQCLYLADKRSVVYSSTHVPNQPSRERPLSFTLQLIESWKHPRTSQLHVQARTQVTFFVFETHLQAVTTRNGHRHHSKMLCAEKLPVILWVHCALTLACKTGQKIDGEPYPRYPRKIHVAVPTAVSRFGRSGSARHVFASGGRRGGAPKVPDKILPPTAPETMNAAVGSRLGSGVAAVTTSLRQTGGCLDPGVLVCWWTAATVGLERGDKQLEGLMSGDPSLYLHLHQRAPPCRLGLWHQRPALTIQQQALVTNTGLKTLTDRRRFVPPAGPMVRPQ